MLENEDENMRDTNTTRKIIMLNKKDDIETFVFDYKKPRHIILLNRNQ